MPIHDQIGHFLCAFYFHAVNTGDAALITDAWPALMAVVGYVEGAMHAATDGIATTPAPADGRPHTDQADNWL